MAQSKNLITMDRELYRRILEVLQENMFVDLDDRDSDNNYPVCELLELLRDEVGDGSIKE